jgi:hypothetical protein
MSDEFCLLTPEEKEAAHEVTAYAPTRSYWQDAWSNLKNNKSALFGRNRMCNQYFLHFLL